MREQTRVIFMPISDSPRELFKGSRVFYARTVERNQRIFDVGRAIVANLRGDFTIRGVMTVYETTSHNTIYHWATARGLWPASLAGEPDRIRLGGDPDANPGEELEPIEWWRWFQEFERRQLQLVYDPSKGWFTLGSRLAPSGG